MVKSSHRVMVRQLINKKELHIASEKGAHFLLFDHH